MNSGSYADKSKSLCKPIMLKLCSDLFCIHTKFVYGLIKLLVKKYNKKETMITTVQPYPQNIQGCHDDTPHSTR